jgi:hypothetical protein
MRTTLACRVFLLAAIAAPDLARADELPPPPAPQGAAPPKTGLPPELALGASQLVLPDLQDIIDDGGDRPDAAAVAYGQLVAGTTGVGLGGGAAAAVAGVSCDLLSGSVQGVLHAGSDDAAPVAGVARYELCLDAGIFLRIRGDRAAGLAPAIDARRSLWRRPYAEQYQNIEMGLGPLWDHGPNRYSIFHMAFGHGKTEQIDRDVARRTVAIDFDFVLVGYRHARTGSDVQIDALAITNDALKAGDSDLGAVTTGIYPVRASIETGAWFGGAHVGWQWAGGQATQTGTTQVDDETTSSYSETVDSSGLPAFGTPAGAGWLGMRRGRVIASTTVSHELYPTFDGNLALESRATGSLAVALGVHRTTTVSLSPFLARTQTWVRDAGDGFDTSAGATLQLDHPLPHSLSLDAVAEAGSSPYARLDGSRAPNDALGGQVMVALGAKHGLAEPHHKF